MLNLFGDFENRLDAGQNELRARLDRIIELLEQLVATERTDDAAALHAQPARRRTAKL